MRSTLRSFFGVAVLLCLGFSLSSAQIVSNGTGGGNWSAASTWAGGVVPTGSGTITIRAADSVAVDVAVTITGTLVDSAKVAEVAALTFGNGGTYNRASNGGRIPTATWNTGSTCLLTGTVSTAPSNASQNFCNLTMNLAMLGGRLNLGMSGNTISGNLTVLNTNTGGGDNRMYLTSSGAFASPITISGDVTVSGTSAFSINGSSSAGTVNPIVVNTYGNVTVTGGNFGCSRGSGPSVTWNLYGNMSVSNATLQNSGTAANVAQKFVFAKAGTQTLTFGSGVAYASSASPINMEVASGTTLDIGSSVISSSNTGGFKLLDGATLISSGGSIACASTSGASIGNTFVTASNVTGSGNLTVAAHGVTHPHSPDASKTLARYWTITAAPGITQADLKFYYLASDIQGSESNYAPMKYTGTGTSWVLGSSSNAVDLTFHFATAAGVTGISGEWTVGESSLANPTSVEATPDRGIPESLFVSQNYPNPFNPSTTITYGLPTSAFVTAKVLNLLGQEVATLFAGDQDAGIHVLTFDASHLSSGVYLSRIQAGSSVEVKRMILMK
jgi:hypothetical protein